MAPILSLLSAALTLPSPAPSHPSTWQSSILSPTGSWSSPSTRVSKPGPKQPTLAATTTSPIIAAASTPHSSSLIASSVVPPTTNHILELRDQATTCGNGYVSCSNPGGIVCVGHTKFGICAMNSCALVQDLAAGVDCAIFNPTIMTVPAPVDSSSSSVEAASENTASPTAQASLLPHNQGPLTSTSTTSSSSATITSTKSTLSLPSVSTSETATSSIGGLPQPSANATTGLSPNSTLSSVRYKTYTGDGANFPSESSWVSSFDELWESNLNNVINQVCSVYGANTADESATLKSAIESSATGSGLDPRFILAVVMQESRGCVRVITTAYDHANPGLLQDYNGPNSCNKNGVKSMPCSDSEITGMINDGVFGNQSPGQAQGAGLLQNYDTAADKNPVDAAARYYITARIYNSGSYVDNNLGCGVATHCYASDVANRLVGWTGDTSPCSSTEVSAQCATPVY